MCNEIGVCTKLGLGICTGVIGKLLWQKSLMLLEKFTPI